MNYTIKGLKSFIGNEGYGYNVSLYRDGKKVAFVIDDASGGEVDFQWLDWKGGRSLEEMTLLKFLEGKMSPPCWEGDTESQMDTSAFVAGLIDDYEHRQKLIRRCKTKTVFRLVGDEEGSYREAPVKFTPKVKENLLATLAKQGKELAEIYNETFAKKE